MGRLLQFPVLALVLQGLFFEAVNSSHFRGITLSWKPTDNSSEIDIEWGLWWRRSSMTMCDDLAIANGTVIGGPGSFECEQCSSQRTIATGYYQCTDYSEAEDWQAGVGSTTYAVEPELEAFDIRFTSCCWITLGNGGSTFSAQAHVNLTSVDGEINSSPVTSWLPIFRVAQGCQATLNIPVADPDGDDVRCRWPSNTAEAGDVTQMSGAVLDGSNCILTINAPSSATGWYGVALVVEDFASPSSMVAKSKVPLQFLVNVYSSYNHTCGDKPTLIDPTPAQGQQYCLATGAQISIQIRARATAAPIIEIETTSPLGMITSSVALVPGRTNEYYIMATWTPTTSQLGPHTMCFNALDSDGLTSEVRCVHLSVGVPPTVIESVPAPESQIPLTVGLWTFKFDQNVTLAVTYTHMYFISGYSTGTYSSRSITQTAGDTIDVLLVSGKLYPGQEYSVTLYAGVVTSNGLCPIPSVSHNVRVYTSSVSGATTEALYTQVTTGVHWLETTTDTIRFPPLQTTTRTDSTARDTWTDEPQTTNPPLAWTTPNQVPNPPFHTQPAQQPSMECSDSTMMVFIPRSLIGDTMASHLHFLDPACVGSPHNGTHLKIVTTYDRCGTFMEVHGDNVIFFNVIHDEAVPITPGSVITRDRDIEIPVQCIMDMEGMAQIGFHPDVSKITFHEDGYGSFNFSLRLYHDANYMTPYLPADYPVHAKFGDKLYFEARTWSKPGLKLFVQTCRATPTPNPDDFHRYIFIKDGCMEDNSLQFHPSYDPDVERFEIDVFAFIDTLPQPVVYVHCDMILCNSSDAHSKCAMGCATGNIHSLLSLHRRSARSASGSRAYAITQGPISLMENQGEEASSGMSSVQMPVLLATVCLLVGCVLVLGGVVALMRKRSGHLKEYQPVPIDED